MPPVKELRWPRRIGEAVCAMSAGAATFVASAAPVPAEYLMNVRRETRLAREPCLFMRLSLGAKTFVGCDFSPAAAVILSGRTRGSLVCFGLADRCRMRPHFAVRD